jgi:glycosyltransferase involved in cell wall biosynthesis
MHREFDVTVVIPTTGSRPDQLRRAVASALSQSGVRTEVVVCFDGPILGGVIAQLPRDGVIIAQTQPPDSGGNAARMVGVRAAKADLTAFLDDDDWWEPDKLKRQLSQVPYGSRWIAGTGIRLWISDDRTILAPRRRPTKGEGPARYLFRRRSLHWHSQLLHTSTLLFPTSLAREVPLTLGLPRHQDWDWLLRLDRQWQVPLVFTPEHLVNVEFRSRTSLSARPDWRQSAKWVADVQHLLSPREAGDILLTVTAWMALAAMDRSAARRLFKYARRHYDGGLVALLLFAARYVVTPWRR